MTYENECQIALEAASIAAEILQKHYIGETKTWEKKKGDPVTAADIEADAAIRDILAKHFPNDGILSEEWTGDSSRVEKERVWIIDPMDGTREFTRKIPEFCTSIAFSVAGEPVVGVVKNPANDVSVWATKDGGTFKDGVLVRVSDTQELSRASVIASRTEVERGKFDGRKHWFSSIQPMGSIAWKLACVACGEADLNVSFSAKNEWDVCAGDLLIREAGGVYTDFDGETRVYNQLDPLIDKFMVAGPRNLVNDFCTRESMRRS